MSESHDKGSIIFLITMTTMTTVNDGVLLIIMTTKVTLMAKLDKDNNIITLLN